MFTGSDTSETFQRAPHYHKVSLLRRSIIAAITIGFLTMLPAVRAHAYDSDTHFLLTYYVARAAGFTPEQAYRIASADVGVDNSADTEPEQYKDIYGSWYNPYRVLVYGPAVRTDFHAFRDYSLYPLSSLADSEIAVTLGSRLSQARTQKNPGVYLHAYQDSFAHAGYWSLLGHWDWLSTLKDLNTNHGHSPDYLAYHAPAQNMSMVKGSLATMLEFKTNVFPYRAVDQSAISAALTAVTNANKVNDVADPNFYAARSALVPHLPRYDYIYDPLKYEFQTNWTVLNPPAIMSCTPSTNSDYYAIWNETSVQLEQIPNQWGIDYGHAVAQIAVFEPWFDNDTNETGAGYRDYGSLLLTPSNDTYEYPAFPVGKVKVNFRGRGVNFKSLPQDVLEPQNNLRLKVDWTNFVVRSAKNNLSAGEYTLYGFSLGADIKHGAPKGSFNTLIHFKDGDNSVNLYFGGANSYANGVYLNSLNWDNFSAYNCHVQLGATGPFLTGTFEVKTDTGGHSSFRFTAQGLDGRKKPVNYGCGWTPLPSGAIVSAADGIS